ncbi:MAG: dienelactone hydrolase [Trueperaceae bacterium]|nr:dienelactone hydrolase [Trueperaceae bacterium]
MSKLAWIPIALVLALGCALAQSDNRIDLQRPDAPELAAFGDHAVGVRTLEVVDPDRIDVLNTIAGAEAPRYDRPLTLEVWYPAVLPEGAVEGGTYEVVTRDGTIAQLTGRAVRDAEPAAEAGPYPLVVLSHGYPGNRFLIAHFGENLASKGYVVASIDHTDSTYPDQGAFASTLYNRPLDQLFVVDEMDRRSAAAEGFLSGLIDASRTGIIGYSMGGYGLVNVLGAGFTEASTQLGFAPPNGLLAERQMGNEAYEASFDPRIGAAVAIAPWGMPAGFWDADGLAAIETPVLFMAGSEDDVSGYANGTRAIFEGAVNAERYLLTFENARHNAAAPIPAPRETWAAGTFAHYAESVWDTVRMNNVAQHFVTAFFDLHLKGDEAMAPYLDLVEDAVAGVWSVDDAGAFTSDHTYWLGFQRRTALGLRFERGVPAGE